MPNLKAVLEASVDVSSAELKNLVAAPKQLVPAPGAGKIVVPFQAMISYLPGTAYTNTSWLGLGYAGVAGNATPWVFFSMSAVLAGTTASLDFMEPRGAQDTATVAANNDALVLTNNNGVDVTVGTGTLRVTVWYSILTL